MKAPVKKTPASAVDILIEDHKKVEKIFSAFEALKKKGGSAAQKGVLVKQACDELTVHAEVEEEIFYPAVRKAIGEPDLMDEAIIEHAEAKDLIAQLQDMKPTEAFYDAKFTVLSENIRHHVKEEQDEMFPKAKKSKLDLEALGEKIIKRKQELKLELGMKDDEEDAAASKSKLRTGTRG